MAREIYDTEIRTAGDMMRFLALLPEDCKLEFTVNTGFCRGCDIYLTGQVNVDEVDATILFWMNNPNVEDYHAYCPA